MVDSSNDLGLQMSLRKTRGDAVEEASGENASETENLIEIPRGLARRFIILP